ncbi:MAG: hypothetical protein GKS01_04255 [Alphaproteobacteria bacterium]|nr:hypothetical protein [Alphaproteobacteria bacterium]
MGQTKKITSSNLLDASLAQAPTSTSKSVLRDVAVAIDPPPDGAVGIHELLDRLDFLAEADFFSPKEQSLGTTRSFIEPSSSWNIYDFADSQIFTRPLDITGWKGDDLQLMLRQMIRSQATTHALMRQIDEGLAANPPTLNANSVALETGVSRNILSQDQVVRIQLLPEHPLSVTDEFWHAIETAASVVPASDATGSSVVVAYINAQDIEEKSTQERLRSFHDNKYKILFVCQHTLPSQRRNPILDQEEYCAAQYADNIGMEWAIVDGNDVVAIAIASAALIDRTRKGRGVGFLEAVTFDNDMDLEISDPITRLKQAMVARGDINHAGFEILETLEKQMVSTAEIKASATPSV